jgi:hypothetical protein
MPLHDSLPVFLQIRSNATNPDTGDPITMFICVGYYRIVNASISATEESTLLTLAEDQRTGWTVGVGSEWEIANIESIEALNAIEGPRKAQVHHRTWKPVIPDGASWRTRRMSVAER